VSCGTRWSPGRAFRGQIGDGMSQPIWLPDPDQVPAANVSRFARWLTEQGRAGRSDATLNRHGIRMGSSDIYHAVEQVDEIAEALVVGVERPEGEYWMPLFVVLKPGHQLDDALAGTIRRAIRDGASPRHVPDEIIAAPAIPHTRTGKKLEIPVKRILQGGDPSLVMDPGAVDHPDALAWFAAFTRELP
jgi:acetoacetyl-CoA synthetase